MMSRLLTSTQERFATGEARFSTRPALEGERLSRVLVQIQLAEITAFGVVDTGGAYLVLPPNVGGRIGLTPTTALGAERVSLRGFVVDGSIHRVPVTLPATAGEPLTFEATAFVPQLHDGERWPFPSYLGWQGCLERIRFAVDPGEELIYFGALRG
jgi:hypothetical protein